MTTDSRRLFTGLPGFAAATIALIAVFGWVMTLFFRGPGDSIAIRISAVVAAAIQIAAFPAVKGLATRNLMLGWAAGTFVRFLTLVFYALAAGPVLHLPLPAALVSLFVFYFLSMVIEPLFLRS
jgi:hypothetical protein